MAYPSTLYEEIEGLCYNDNLRFNLSHCHRWCFLAGSTTTLYLVHEL